MSKNRFNKEKQIPDIFQNIKEWEVNRRQFVKTLSLTAIVSQIGLINSCQSKENLVYQVNEYLTALESEIIQKIQEILFPNDGNGPSVTDINAFSHLVWVLSDVHKDTESKEYIIKGIRWTEETSQEIYGRTFSDLNDSEVKAIVAFMAEKNWGSSWLSIILTLIFEALSLDPIYNVNTNKIGWQWLEHPNGTPRPNSDNSYYNIFKTIHAK